MSEGLTGNLACVAVMPDESADDGPVLLLDPSLVVLSICPGTGELDPTVCTVLHKRLVDEYAVVVRVDTTDGDRELSANDMQTLDHERLLTRQERDRFGPPRAHARGDKAVDESARECPAAMCDQVDLEESWGRRVPVSKRPHRNLPARPLPPDPPPP